LSDRPRYRWSVGFLLPGIGVDRLARLGDITLLPVERDDHGQFQCTGTLFVETNSPGKDKRAIEQLAESAGNRGSRDGPTR